MLEIALVPVLFYYHSIIDRPVATTTMRDYLVAEMLHADIDPQIMVKIVNCESRFRQFDSKGNPLRSPTSDIGLMQINQVHWKRAKKLGLDIFNSTKDNVEMGKIIYKEQGFEAWSAYESSCYKKQLVKIPARDS